MQHGLSGSCHEVHHATLRGDQARRVSQRPEPGDFGVASDMHLRWAPFLPTVPAGQAGLRVSSRHTRYAVWRVRPRKSNGILPITTSSRTRHETTQFISCWRALSLFAQGVGSWGFYSNSELLSRRGPSRPPAGEVSHSRRRRTARRVYGACANSTSGQTRRCKTTEGYRV